jgi:hypothetical protein
MAKAGKDIEHLSTGAPGIENTARGEERQVVAGGEFALGANDAFFTAEMLPLQFDINTIAAEGAREAFQDLRRRERFRIAGMMRFDGANQRAILVTGQRNEAFGEFRQFLPTEAAFTLGGAEMAVGHEAAEVLVADARFDQDRQDRAALESQFRADDGPDAGFACFGVESRRSVDTIAIGEGDGGHAKFSRGFRQVFGERCAAQKTEGAAGMQFHV